MPRVSLEKLVEQQNDTTKIRNLCIIAHVDHGKTTLCDALISSNGIISERLAGQMRYMDNRKDEQEKLITMKCSSISLLFPPDITDNNYLINLIDSPGHVDFTGEVSSAVRISDGALVLVDVAEGICAQTQTVLRQAWNERVKPCLVLNKIDRLFTELNQTPEEAYYHLHKILESVNVVMANIITEDLVFSDDYNPSLSSSEKKNNQNKGGENNDQPADHEDSYFSPERGNVLFASAVDGWGFRIDHFADLYAKRFGMKREALLKCLWGEYYLKVDKKVENKNNTIKIFTTSQNGKLPRLFVEFVLKNVWQLYNTVFSELSIEKAKKIVQTLKLDVPNRELAALERYQSKSNNKPYKDQALRNVLRSIARKWLPLSESILSMCVDQLPSPVDSQSQRIPKLWRSLPPSSPSPLLDNIKLIENDLYRANKDSEHMVAFISKVFAAPFEGGVVGDAGPRIVVPSARSTLVNSNNSNNSDNSDNELIASLPSHKQRSDEKFIGFARIFCGTIRKGQEVFVLAPKYDPRYPDKHISSFVVNELYSLMGRALEPIEYASAGMVFGIGGIEAHVLKTATLTTLPLIPTFSEVQFSQSIVRVAVEPVNPAEMDILAKGLQLLNQADASVEVLLHDRDQIISAAGELHLERCLRDLKEFAPIDIKVSPPIVSFKETIIEAGKEFTQTMKSSSVSFKIRCTPLPISVTLFLEQNSERIYQLFGEGIDSKNSHEFTKFNNNFIAKLIDAGHSFTSEFENIWSFGTNRNGPNILFNHIPGYFNSPYWKSICSSYAAKDLNDEDIENAPTERVNDDDEERVYTKEELKRIKFLLSVDYAIVNGFQYATLNGPLCGEQMRGCAFFIEDFKFDENSENTTFFKGMITSSLTNAFKQSFLNCSTRLVEPFYHCNINVADHMFGKTSGVLFKRRGRITNNERKGTDGFTIEAVIPVVESFGLSDELMKKTSGSASVQLWFSHWEILDIDPNWEPTTEDEIEEFGSNAQARGGNIARQLVDDVRRRKGMFVEEKLVESADKQRNLSKNK